MNTLKEQYEGLIDFKEYHKINSPAPKNPMYDNCREINKLCKKLNYGFRVKTIYPTNDSVTFKVIKAKS